MWYIRNGVSENPKHKVFSNFEMLRKLFIDYVSSYDLINNRYRNNCMPNSITQILNLIYDNIPFEKNEDIIKISFEIIKIKPYWKFSGWTCTDNEITLILKKVYEIFTKYLKYTFGGDEHFMKCIEKLFKNDE